MSNNKKMTASSSNPRKCVVVVWEDIVTRGDWVGSKEEVLDEVKLMHCATVGWVLSDTKEKIVLVDSASKDREYGGVTVIPKSVVKSIEILAKKSPSSYFKT